MAVQHSVFIVPLLGLDIGAVWDFLLDDSVMMHLNTALSRQSAYP